MSPVLPPGKEFTDFTVLNLDEHGNFLDPGTGRPVPHDDLPIFLERSLTLPGEATDIVVFVHGWNNTAANAAASAARLFNGIEIGLAEQCRHYPDNAGTIRGWPTTAATTSRCGGAAPRPAPGRVDSAVGAFDGWAGGAAGG